MELLYLWRLIWNSINPSGKLVNPENDSLFNVSRMRALKNKSVANRHSDIRFNLLQFEFLTQKLLFLFLINTLKCSIKITHVLTFGQKMNI